MAYLDHIRACNRFDPDNFIPFRIAGVPVGWLRHGFAEALAAWPRVFRVDRQAVDLNPSLVDFETRTDAVAEVVEQLEYGGVISHRLGEPYPVTTGEREPALMLLDRAAAPYFGIRAFGQHLNGYVLERGGIHLWVARRSQDRRNYPGKLDNMVAGGLPYGISLAGNLAKEAWEEAGVEPDLIQHARPVGAICYCKETERGLKPDILYCYDLQLPADFEPRCTDGEVEAFELWPLERVAGVVRDTDRFKRNCNLVIIDFLIRHGLIGPGDADYPALAAGLRASLPGL